MLTSPRILSLVLFIIAFLVPSFAQALEYSSDFDDFSNDWLLESGSDVDLNASSIVLRASDTSEKMRGRILLKSILATTPEEINHLIFTIDAPDVSAPFAARAFYYDENGDFLGSDPLFGTQSAGPTIALGTVLNPSTAVRGLRVRLYSNAQTGSITLDKFTITTPIQPVPEPNGALLMCLGLAGLASVRRVG